MEELKAIESLTGEISAIVAIPLAMEAIKRYAKTIHKSRLYARIQPIVPILLGAAFSFLPFKEFAELETLEALKQGVHLGLYVALGYKFYNQSIRGKDPRLNGASE